MRRRDEATFVLHGLDADNRIVRVDVFAKKLSTLIAALRESDKFANGSIAHDFMITDLKMSSALIKIREKQKRRRGVINSGIGVFESVTTAVYNGDRGVSKFPTSLVRKVERLGQGVQRTFSHADLAFPDNVIRIDDYLTAQAQDALETTDQQQVHGRGFKGLAHGIFDGVLKEIDARGLILRGKLVLSAGGLEIDCVMDKDKVETAAENFDKRAVIEGMAHYDFDSKLPRRIDVLAIRPVKATGDLIRWRGAMEGISQLADQEDDW